VPGNSGFFQEENGSVSIWRKRGEDLCKMIYGDHYSKLMENMRELHPDLAEWILVEGYGKVLARPFLKPRTRELLIVALTAALGVPRQFESHVRGAIHAGATGEELKSVMQELKDLVDSTHRDHLFELLENCLSSS
jgi:4-carboxymuconolactone decarboxylase